MTQQHNWDNLLRLVDRLHLARVRPVAGCQPAKPLCGGQPVAAHSDLPCGQLAGEGHPFPAAQCILNGHYGDGLFRQVQEQIGILQTVVLFGQLVDEPTRTYTLEHLESIPGLRLRVPWVRRSPDEPGEFETDPRATGIAEVFRQFRERATGVQEFVRLLESENGHELILGSNPSSTDHGLATFYQSSRLDPAEQEHHVLLVSDEEQALFSFLFILAEADAHARELGQRCEEWIDGHVGPLRSILRHQHDALDADPPKVEQGDSAIEVPSGDYWSVASFDDAMVELGLISRDASGGHVSPRFERLVTRLRGARGWYVLQESQTPSDSGCANLADAVAKFCFDALQHDAPSVRRLAQCLLVLLRAVYDARDGAEAVRRSPNVRFNLPGEYLLRRGETSSRSFFATPLSYAHETQGRRPLAAAFAVGTLDDFNDINEETLPRLHALRVLLRALVTFGTDVAQSWLLTSRRDAETVQDLNHSIRNAFGPVLFRLHALEAALETDDRSRLVRGLESGLKVVRWLLIQALPGLAGEENLPPTSIIDMLKTIKMALDTDTFASTLRTGTSDWTITRQEANYAFSVVFNLWYNAVNAADDRAPQVTIDLFEHRSAQSGTAVFLSIANNGRSLSPEYRAFLLGTALPPVDAPSGRRRKGLRLVSSRTRSLGWRIVDVSCGSGGGTTVLLCLGSREGGTVQ